MLKMTDDERKAYEWAKSQDFTSVAATHARTLAKYIERCKSDEAMLADPADKMPTAVIS